MHMHNMQQRVAFASLFLAAAVSAGPFMPSAWFPLDPQVGTVDDVSEGALVERLRGKSALVVGGTDGIGRGTAIAMARAGASVVVAGRSAAKAQAVLANMSAVARFPPEQTFKAYLVDLLTVKGCLGLTGQLRGNKTRFDYVVLTVGMWPDWKDPRTADGLDKVIALDVVSRFVVSREILPLLNSGARVMSILVSTWRFIFWKDVTSITASTMQDITAGKFERYSLPEMLGTAGTVGDSWLQVMARRHHNVSFIGTFPGVVATDLLGHGTFPWWATPFINRVMKVVGMEPEECGMLHATIISSPNAARRPATYFRVGNTWLGSGKMEGRLANSPAYDAEFGQWVWSFLEGTVANHTMVTARDDSRAPSHDALVV